MTDKEIEKFCEDQPAAADSLISALKRAIDFRARGRLLAGLVDSQPASDQTKDPS